MKTVDPQSPQPNSNESPNPDDRSPRNLNERSLESSLSELWKFLNETQITVHGDVNINSRVSNHNQSEAETKHENQSATQKSNGTISLLLALATVVVAALAITQKPYIVSVVESRMPSRTQGTLDHANPGITAVGAIAPGILPPTPVLIPIPMEPLFNTTLVPTQPDLSTPEKVIQEYYKRLDEFLNKDVAQRQESQDVFLSEMATLREPLPNWNFQDQYWQNWTGASIQNGVQLLSNPNASSLGYESRYGICVQWSMRDGTTEEEPWIVIFNWSKQPGKIIGMRAQGNSDWCQT